MNHSPWTVLPDHSVFCSSVSSGWPITAPPSQFLPDAGPYCTGLVTTCVEFQNWPGLGATMPVTCRSTGWPPAAGASGSSEPGRTENLAAVAEVTATWTTSVFPSLVMAAGRRPASSRESAPSPES